LIRLAGWTPEEMLIRENAAMHMVFPSGPSFLFMRLSGKRQSPEEACREIRDYLKKVRLYGERKRLAASRPGAIPHEYEEGYEAMLPVVEGRLPLMLTVQTEKDIRAAVEMIREEKLRAVFFGAAEAWKTADELHEAGIPVILGNLYAFYHNFDDGYDRHWRNAAVLQKAGVKFAFGTEKALPPLGKDLPFFAAKAVAFGLDKRAALRAVTLSAAEILGVDDCLGSLEPGKLAHIVLADGDPFEFSTRIRAVFIDGRPVDLSNLYTEKIEEYEKRFR
jgi:imidazolonepropionase-like amidohydrolase